MPLLLYFVGSVVLHPRELRCRAQRVVAAYEGKQAEVQREAAGLRAALEHLQKEHRALVNQQVCA